MNYKIEQFQVPYGNIVFSQSPVVMDVDLFQNSHKAIEYEPIHYISAYESPHIYQSEDKYSTQIDAILSKYCMCDGKMKQNIPLSNPMTNYDLLSEIQNKRVSITDICLTTLMKKLSDTLKILPGDLSSFVTFHKKKHDRTKSSNRRSLYIGVSKNGPSWQSMITVNKRKTYIGTYKTEREAAIAFDFYSMLIHALEGKTNFSYTKGQVFEMINNFIRNDQVLLVYQLSF